MIINTLRTYERHHTDGLVYVNGQYFGHSLEDISRPAGVKIAGDTCILEGSYFVDISFSPKFQREMLIIFNNKIDHSIERKGVRFTGIRSHGGNSIDHTAGCPMVAAHSDKEGKIHGSLESELFEMVKTALSMGEEVIWVFSEKV